MLEYFQPNIAKPLHVGHMRTAIIGDCLKRMLLHLGHHVESDTHMGDWGTQFGFLILAHKKFGEVNEKRYAELNAEAEKDPSVREHAKQEFVKLEQGDKENRKIWQGLVEESVKKFLNFAQNFGLLPFDHHWPESFYEDKMPDIVIKLKSKKLLKLSQGAQVVNLEDQGLGVAIIIKSDGGTTYLLRDLATFIFGKQQGFAKHLYVVDNRQSLHYKQLFAILKLMGEMGVRGVKGEGIHIDYGFMSFKGEALSTRKGNIVKASDLLAEAEAKVAKIIADKNPDLKNKQEVIRAVAKAALKYFDLKHNRHSDIEFDWDQALDFEGNSGPYLQYTYARLASILRKTSTPLNPPLKGGKEENSPPNLGGDRGGISSTEHRVLFLSSIFTEKVAEAIEDYLPNLFANYLYELVSAVNKFYHESPVLQEKDENKKSFRLQLVKKAKEALGKGLDLLGIKALDEM
ncbi:MAG: arginine--tRNA ligase [Candidatus Doudnabacteria bacterium]|nr:arginine--tRNA ligase [Candidatus Doudnabacteria bacterium]